SMGGHGMGSSATTKAACKISMLWNWNTVNSCFIARSWHNRTLGHFAGSCIGIFFLVFFLELIRRAQREWDRSLLRKRQNASNPSLSPSESPVSTTGGEKGERKMGALRVVLSSGEEMGPTMVEQLVRSGFFVVQFGVAYIVMLLAMYYNGYVIIMILLGAFFGHFVF
ncbi:Ctr copper transporter, partial [Ascodesmis nigricans]